MRVWIPPDWLVITLNFGGILLLQLATAWITTKVPLGQFQTDAWLYRTRPWERDGKIWKKLFGVTSWKDHLPDGAAFFRNGMKKNIVHGRNPHYLDRLARETCRAELTHTVVLAFVPVFWLWNDPISGLVITGFIALANLPCVIVQRFNRPRLLRAAAAVHDAQAQ